MINVCIEVGRLTRDCEVLETAGGMCIVKFDIAVNTRVKKDGEWADKANYFPVKMVGKRAEAAAPYLHKGLKISVMGHLEMEEWQGRDGKRHTAITIMADELDFAKDKAAQTDSGETYGEDIPF